MQANASSEDVRLAFDFWSKGSTVWIYNISLQEVDIIKEDPKINFPFYYNANIEKKKFILEMLFIKR